MAEHTDNTTQQPPMANSHNHNLSWIAMVVMAGMCLAALLYAGSINVG